MVVWGDDFWRSGDVWGRFQDLEVGIKSMSTSFQDASKLSIPSTSDPTNVLVPSKDMQISFGTRDVHVGGSQRP
jgi:hypothetical protein